MIKKLIVRPEERGFKMSKLIDKLTKLAQTEQKPMGFMISKAAPEKPRMQLVARVTAEVLEKSAQSLSAADAVILEVAKADDISALEKAVQVKDGPAAGARLKTASAGMLKKTLNSGLDFVVFSAEAPLSLTKDEKLGKVLETEPGLSDILLRTIGDLPVDAVIAVEKEVEEILSLKRLMDLQRLVYLINKPLLVSVPLSFSVEELQALCDMGVKGVVVDVVDNKSAEKLTDLRQVIEKLKKPTPRKKDKMSATIPHLQAEAPEEEEEQEEEDE